jgi:hypothetical protein
MSTAAELDTQEVSAADVWPRILHPSRRPCTANATAIYPAGASPLRCDRVGDHVGHTTTAGNVTYSWLDSAETTPPGKH